MYGLTLRYNTHLATVDSVFLKRKVIGKLRFII